MTAKLIDRNSIPTITAPRKASVKPGDIVRYHGTIASMHGLWRVSEVYASYGRCTLRAGGETLSGTRMVSFTKVDTPLMTDRRRSFLSSMWAERSAASTCKRAENTRVRAWALKAGLLERHDKYGYQLTELGAAIAESVY